ncbi:uncharacterized protein LOC119173905 [Rhipicephalus microplus]|uniref:uncharacterized protein LOC119173905 n=1 Tax=Rhipicephalus microplus TaxID=6941 RepID=UPI003F6C8E78
MPMRTSHGHVTMRLCAIVRILRGCLRNTLWLVDFAAVTATLLRAARRVPLTTLKFIAFTAVFFVVVTVALASLLLAVMSAPRIAEKNLSWRPLYKIQALTARINMLTGFLQNHTTLVCTVGTGVIVRRKAYPPDGVCHYTVFTHVAYDQRADDFKALGAASTSQVATSWRTFLREASGCRRTRLLPSYGDWEEFVGALEPSRARRLNASLVRHRLHGLALLHVRVRPSQLAVVAGALRLLAEQNPGMFIALGISFEGVNDANALRAFPPGVLDRAVTPLSLLVLETHVPPPDHRGRCRASLPSIRDVDEFEGNVRLSLSGAVRILGQHPELRHVVGTPALAGCFSVFLGALVFNTSGQEAKLGAVCTSWSADKISEVCEHPSVRLDERAVAAYGQDGRRFFSFESVRLVVPKLTELLNGTLQRDRAPCLALYNMELNCGVCSQCISERYPNIIGVVHDLLSRHLRSFDDDERAPRSTWERLLSFVRRRD